MFGHDSWRPLTVVALASGALLLPQGVAAAAEPDPLNGVTCAQLGEQLRADGLACTPLRHDGVDGVFVGPLAGARPGTGPDTPGEDAPDATPRAAACAPTAAEPGTPAPGAGSPIPDEDEGGGSDTETARARGLTGLPGVLDAAGAVPAVTPQVVSEAAATATSIADTLVAAAALAADAERLPGDVIDLDQWYLTLPTGTQGDPDTIENPDLARFTNEFFKLNEQKDAVVFSANGDGVTTKNSKYPRSELREMNGTEKAAWSNTSGTHTLDVCEAITQVPQAKPEVVAAQIHDGNDDVLQIRLEGRTLMVQYDDGKSEEVIDPDYALGTPYQVKIVAADSKVEVHYNGEKKADLPLAGEGWYWKVGAYVQSNADKGDGADAVGEVTVYSIENVHA